RGPIVRLPAGARRRAQTGTWTRTTREATPMRRSFKSATLAALLALPAPAALAQDAIADFYRGKSIRFVIGAISGGGNDTYARLVGRHLGKHIPGNPAIL